MFQIPALLGDSVVVQRRVLSWTDRLRGLTKIDASIRKNAKVNHHSLTLAKKKGLTRLANPLCLMAGATGLEPATFGVTGRRSNQLNYAPRLTKALNRVLNLILR
jgi:hypothetical protein